MGKEERVGRRGGLSWNALEVNSKEAETRPTRAHCFVRSFMPIELQIFSEIFYESLLKILLTLPGAQAS
jgi:hypothetical protein